MKSLKWISVFVILIITMNTVVFASSYSTITVDEATEKAISYSRTLLSLSENTVIAQENYDEILKDFLITDQSHEALNLAVRLKTATNQLTNLSASQELEKESIKLDVVNFFFSVLKAEEELELYKENLEIAKKELKIAEVKRDLGIISYTDYNTQKLAYDKQVVELSNKELTITNAYRSLNNVLGVSTDTRYDLILDDEYLTFSSIENEVSLTSYIISGLNNSNKLTELEQSVDLAKYSVDNYTHLNASSLQSVEISYYQAQRNLSEAKTSLEQSITDLYNNILQIEDNYTLKKKEIDEKEQEVMLLEIKLSLGSVTELELEKAKYQLENLKLELKQLIFNHNISKMKLENTNLM